MATSWHQTSKSKIVASRQFTSCTNGDHECEYNRFFCSFLDIKWGSFYYWHYHTYGWWCTPQNLVTLLDYHHLPNKASKWCNVFHIVVHDIFLFLGEFGLFRRSCAKLSSCAGVLVSGGVFRSFIGHNLCVRWPWFTIRKSIVLLHFDHLHVFTIHCNVHFFWAKQSANCLVPLWL